VTQIRSWHRSAFLWAASFGFVTASAWAGDTTSADAIINALSSSDNTRGIGVAKAADGPPPSVNLNVPFEVNSAQLRPDAADQLDALAAALGSEALATIQVEIVGHTDSSGAAGYNQQLSLKRAESVRAYLSGRKGIDAARMIPVGRGESEPIPGSRSEDPQNRRVEVRLANHD
jgi:outer membrane protein OmpA-like peptidoglycan-associated protein